MKKIKLTRVTESAIAVVLILVVIYIASMTFKVTSGISRTVESPTHQIRLQVLNGCGVRGQASRMADILAGFTDEEIEILIVDTDNFDLTEISTSFLISRTEDSKAAELLADKLGLDRELIEYRPMEPNYRHVSVTLVLGADYEAVRIIDNTKTETREKN